MPYDLTHTCIGHYPTMRTRRVPIIGCSTSEYSQAVQAGQPTESQQPKTNALAYVRAVALLLPLYLTPCVAAEPAEPAEPPAAQVVFSSVSAGIRHSCAVSAQGRLYCWGDGRYDQLGLGRTTTMPDDSILWSLYRHAPPPDGQVAESDPVNIDDATDWKQVSAGETHTCAIKTNGQLYCWGYGEHSQLGAYGASSKSIFSQFAPAIVDPAIEWAQVDAYGSSTCAVSTGGGLYCWGLRSRDMRSLEHKRNPGVTRIGDATDWKQVSVGSICTCALKTTGRLHCWGYSQFGGLGSDPDDATDAENAVGHHLPDLASLDWKQVSVSIFHICAVKTDGRLYCWGRGDLGRLGQGDSTARKRPAQVGSDSDWLQVSAGISHTCALKTNTRLYCWGNNDQGQLGLGGFDIQDRPVQVGSGWQEVNASQWHTCAVKVSGQLYCWGSVVKAVLRTNAAPYTILHPTPVGTDANWTEISTGLTHTCAINAIGELYCWGESVPHNDALDYMNDQYAPVRIDDRTDWSKVSTGFRSTCAVNTGGELYCWGKGRWPPLEPGVADEPTRIGTDADWKMVSVSLGGHTCAVTTTGKLYCWGECESGQMGLGDILHQRPPESDDSPKYWRPPTHHQRTPAQVGSGTDWEHVSTGHYHTCAVKTSGEIYCWGSSRNGRLGVMEKYSWTHLQHLIVPESILKQEGWIGDGIHSTPTQVGDDADWREVCAASTRTCAIKTNGELYCWGLEYKDKELGDYDDNQYTPTQVGSSDDWQQLGNCGASSCAIKTNGELYCWGRNRGGQLGVGDTNTRPTPTRVGNSNDWATSSNQSTHTCAIKTDGRLYCWGRNESGELGIVESTTYDVPTLISVKAD